MAQGLPITQLDEAKGARDRVLYAKAQTLGLVSEDGYLTNAGYQLWRECEG